MKTKMVKMLLVIFVNVLVLCVQQNIANVQHNTGSHNETTSHDFSRHQYWERLEMMDNNGLYWLQWLVSDKDIHFKVTVNTRGFIGLGFSGKDGRMSSADMVLLWVDDYTGKSNALDCHGSSLYPHGAPIQDDTQNYHIIYGYQNDTHTYIEFKRQIETCDPYDMTISGDTLKVLWSFGDIDPIHGGLGGHGQNRGAKSLHLLSPVFRKERIQKQQTHQWDFKVNNVTITPLMETLYWCKIINAPSLKDKHHIIGYEPLLSRVSNADETVVFHMTLFECTTKSYPSSSSSYWDVWVKSTGTVCNSNSLTPRDWDSCSTPVAVWSIGSSGQFLPAHIGIPIGGPVGIKYYMLELHYDNPNGLHFIDNSGFRIYYSPQIRANDGGIIISGVSISDTQMIPPGQKFYRNVGICGPSCSNVLFPENGIKIISATVHSHRIGRTMNLRHVRGGKELHHIIEDVNYDYKYQQFRQMINETIVLPGDYIITECAYDTIHRKTTTFGGYSTKQEMCLSFITYYPKIELTGCYSMIPVREFFEIFGVYQFHSLNMTDVENLFLYNGNLLDYIPSSVYGKSKYSQNNRTAEDRLVDTSLLNKLIISDPIEFHDRTFLSHINQLPWSEPLFTKRVEHALITGKHMTFCRVSNESMSIPSEIIRFPNFTANVKTPSSCTYNFFLDINQVNSPGSKDLAYLPLNLLLVGLNIFNILTGCEEV